MTFKTETTFRFALAATPSLLTVSEGIENLLGYSAQQFLAGQVSLPDLVHPDDHDILGQLFSASAAPLSDDFNIRIRHADGHIRCFRGQHVRTPPTQAPYILELSLRDARCHLENQVFAGSVMAQDQIIDLFGSASDITELKRAEQALIDSEHRFKSIFEHLPSISVQGYDRQRRVIFWNKASETLYGYSHAQALGRQLEDLIIPEPMRQPVIELITAWSDGGPAIPAAELTLQRADGSPVEVFSSHVMLNDRNGQPEMYCIDIDISERKAAEHALRTSESLLRTILDEIPDPIVLKDHKGDFLLGNRAVADLYNTTPEAMVGKHDGDFGVPPEMAEFFRQNVLGIMAKGETQIVFEDSRDAVTGEIRHFRSIKKPLKDAQGKPQILVVAQDVTDVIRAQKQVTESEQRLQHVMEITREGIWDWHLPSGRVIHNLQWYQTLLYAADEVPETVESFTALIHPEDQAMVWQRLDDLLKGVSSFYHSEHRLMRKDGQIIWVQDRGRIVERDAQGQPVRVVGSFSDISFQHTHQLNLERMAHYDTLTGLPNRVLLASRMKHAMQQGKHHGRQLAVAYLDLDGFKTINDRHGHDVGDQLLAAIATEFRATQREGDTIARLGGDEFVAVFADLSDMQSSDMLIRRLLDVASRTMLVNGMALNVSASIGVSFYPQTEETDADLLLRQADQAMYSAKVAGKNRYHLFDAEQDRTLRAHHEGLERIHQALKDDELVLHYQPKVNLRTGDVLGAEALIRWQHPQRGLLAPLSFLPEIEGQLLEITLGEWVLETALTQIEAWHAQGIDMPVSVNMSAHQLQQPEFTRKLQSRLAAHPGVQRGELELEVLETRALEDIGLISKLIKDCAGMGVGFALDDFGTGYSSLTYLKHLPAQVLKIDQSFIRGMLDDPQDLAILEGVLSLAIAFRRQAIAEGAETHAHCELLLRLGCDLAQGIGIARPMAADRIPGWKSTWRPEPGWAKMAGVSRQDLPVVYATVEHRAWLADISACLAGTGNTPQLDPDTCRMCDWLQGTGRLRYGNDPIFKRVEQLHQQVYALAKELLSLHAQGHPTQALALLPQLQAQCDDLNRHSLELLNPCDR